jgi:hypothetical protein
MMNIIEPCCAERQLPQLLREQKGRAVLFQTYGDVTFENILHSVSCMAGNDHLTMTLACGEVTQKMQRTLQRYQDRQWITTLHLLTDDLEGETICIEGDLGTVIIQGPIIDTASTNGRPVLYAGQFAKADAGRHPIAQLLDTRLRRRQAELKAAASVAAATADSVSGAKKKSNRKNKKADEKSNQEMA